MPEYEIISGQAPVQSSSLEITRGQRGEYGYTIKLYYPSAGDLMQTWRGDMQRIDQQFRAFVEQAKAERVGENQ